MNAQDAKPRPGEDRAAAAVLEQAFARMQGELLGTLYYLVGNREDAHDALQDAFVKCWQHRAEVGQVQNMRAWIFRVALNAGRDLRASAWRRRRQPLGDDSMIVSNEPGPDADLDHQERMARLRSALHALRPEEQEIFLLRQNGGMTYDQIANLVGIPLSTVKTRMRLALGRLRGALQGT